jgi:D-amino-acid dehydrogenase
MTADPNSVAIVGAGIVGMSAALYLRRAGLPVAVIDPLPPGGGASYGNAGLISVESCVPLALPGMLREVPRWLADPLAPLTVRPRYLPQALPWLLRWIAAGRMPRVEAAGAALRALHVKALDRYRELLGAEFDSIIRIAGQVHIWENVEPSASEAIYRRLWERHGVAAEWLSADELRQLVPQLTGGVMRAAFLPKNGHTLNPRRLVATLARLFTDAGGTVLGRTCAETTAGGIRLARHHQHRQSYCRQGRRQRRRLVHAIAAAARHPAATRNRARLSHDAARRQHHASPADPQPWPRL